MTVTAPDTFWGQVDIGDGTRCWLWTGTLNQGGYGVTSKTITGSPMAHRVAWVLQCGPIPEGLDLDHLCRVRHCVRPDHLEPVTRGENVRRGWDAGRRRPGQEPGVPTPARTFRVPDHVWLAVKHKAFMNNLTVTDVLNHALEEFLRDDWKDWR